MVYTVFQSLPTEEETEVRDHILLFELGGLQSEETINIYGLRVATVGITSLKAYVLKSMTAFLINCLNTSNRIIYIDGTQLSSFLHGQNCMGLLNSLNAHVSIHSQMTLAVQPCVLDNHVKP